MFDYSLQADSHRTHSHSPRKIKHYIDVSFRIIAAFSYAHISISARVAIRFDDFVTAHIFHGFWFMPMTF
jgi:hypothetical protein